MSKIQNGKMATTGIFLTGGEMSLKNKSNLFVANPREKPREGSMAINVTSQSAGLTKVLSPFFIGPVELYDGLSAKNVENAWQFSKVYKQFLSKSGDILPSYWTWAEKGWNDTFAHRYPMGKGAVPEFALWKGGRLDYIASRKAIYIPLYAKAVVNTKAFETLQKIVDSGRSVTLVDFDVHASGTKNLGETLEDPTKKFGHGFVLYGLLTGEITPEGRFVGERPNLSVVR